MKIYYPISLKLFAKGMLNASGNRNFSLQLNNLLAGKNRAEYNYGLSMLRLAIISFEQKNGVPESRSKARIPFFRENMSQLVGPEMNIYSASLFESHEACLQREPELILAFNYEELGEHCILENLFLTRCKYDMEQAVSVFEKQLEREYEKFFYNEEYTGFASDSQFFSMLCNACLEIRKYKFADQKEWCVASLVMPENADYRYRNGQLESFVSTPVPFQAIERINMPDYRQRRDEYTALIGLLKQQGLNPEGLLEGFE